MRPSITVLMPTRNAESFVGEAIRSIAESSICRHADVEVLVLDGASTDRTHAIVREHEPLARLSVEQDGGMYQALNRGLEEARGEIIGWLNADDLWDREGPAAVLEALMADTSLDFAYGDQSYTDLRTGMFKLVPNDDDAFAALRRGELERADVGTLAMLWRKDAMKRIRWNTSYRMLADYDFWLRAALLEPRLKSRHVPQCVGTFRFHDGSLTWGGARQEQVYVESLRATDEFLARPGLPSDLAKYARAKRRVTLADMIWFQAGQRRFDKVVDYGGQLRELGGHWMDVVARRSASAMLRRTLPSAIFERARKAYRTVAA